MTTLADDHVNEAGLRTYLRNQVGHPDQTVLLTDATVNDSIYRAFRKLNQDFPLISVGTFPTVVDQQLYSPLPATAYRIRRVFWALAGCSCWSQWSSLVSSLDGMLGQPIDEFGTRTLVEPSMVYAFKRHEAWMKMLNPSTATILERSVYLDPVPGSVSTVIFSYEGPRYALPVDIRDDHMEIWTTLAEHYLFTKLSVGAGGVNDITDDDQGTRIRTMEPEHALIQAAAKMRLYNQALGAAPYPVSFP